ncbi:MAG TPA: carbohydrate ABC transporter permease, partial [Trebonia sp.]|nr:carbohydrate ABC transporter permease [Trebonia sp.]
MTTTAERPVETKQGMSAQSRRRMSSLIVGVAAWIIGLIFVTPVLYMLLTSLHSEPDAATNPPSFFAPLTFEGYANFFGSGTGTSPWPSLINSATASILSTILVLVLSIPAAYALSIRPVRKWTDVMFFFLSTKMLPVVAGLLPIYLIAQFAGMLDNVYTLVIIYTSMNLPIAVWMMRSFLAEVPVEMLEAASLDGAGLIRT